jgi:phytoene dehydrogenase-like protein
MRDAGNGYNEQVIPEVATSDLLEAVMQTDYLVLGSGLSALSFGALMAKAGKKVVVLEAHEFPGGYGHTFAEQNKQLEYRFNAQFHYVWDCGEGELVDRVLGKLEVKDRVPFVTLNLDGFDHMRIPGYALDIPADYDKLAQRLFELFPGHRGEIGRFLDEVQELAQLLRRMAPLSESRSIGGLLHNLRCAKLLKYYGKTLQQVFDRFDLPLPAQSLLASQWPDFLLPPRDLAFYCWLVLFDGYVRGPFYPKHHYESVIDTLVDVIEQNGGEVIYNQTVERFNREGRAITGVVARDTSDPAAQTDYSGATVVCNFDPKVAAQMIGMEHFSSAMRKRLSYDYSYSNFIVYGAVKDIDLRDYGFGNWNIFHSEQDDINQVMDDMYVRGDYSKLAFVMGSPSMISDDMTGCPDGRQLFELLTIANYSHFKQLKFRNNKDYTRKKREIYDAMVRVIERDYVPNFSKHVCLKLLGSPTSNESYVWAPEGNSYGANMTPQNMGLFKLGFKTGFRNLYFCNASSGFAGFAKAFQNGAQLYELLSGDPVPVNIQ